MKNIFYFGEKIKDFKIRVFNEKELRAGAGILFLFAIVAFLNSWLLGDFKLTKIFVIIFLIDFFIRIFINPKYSPSLIIGRFIVSNQKPEYIGAPQKKFAWSMGFVLALTMFFVLVVNNVIGPINLFICLACLLMLFFEASFGICIGCKIYNIFNKEKAKLCPAGSCEIRKKEDIQKINLIQVIITILFIILIFIIYNINIKEKEVIINIDNNQEVSDCEVPQWAIDIGHVDQYKLHHDCK